MDYGTGPPSADIHSGDEGWANSGWSAAGLASADDVLAPEGDSNVVLGQCATDLRSGGNELPVPVYGWVEDYGWVRGPPFSADDSDDSLVREMNEEESTINPRLHEVRICKVCT